MEGLPIDIECEVTKVVESLRSNDLIQLAEYLNFRSLQTLVHFSHSIQFSKT